MEQGKIVRAFYGIRWFSAAIAAFFFLHWEGIYGALMSYLLIVLSLHWVLGHFFLSSIDEEIRDSDEETGITHLEKFLSHLQRGRVFLLVATSIVYVFFRTYSFKMWIVVSVYVLGIFGLRLYRYLRHIPIPYSWPRWPRKYLSVLCEWMKAAIESSY